MSVQLKRLMILTVIVISQQYAFKQLIKYKAPYLWINKVKTHNLLEPFLNRDAKTLFKALRFVFNKQYNFNNEEGIRKYRNFKKNLKEINEHNQSKSSFKMGLNHLSVMTNEEIKKFYKLKTINVDELVSNLRTNNEILLDDGK